MRALCLLSLFLLLEGATAHAQDSRALTEPTFPPVCATIKAPLRTNADGPIAGITARRENDESRRQTRQIQNALNACKRGQAVQLTLGATAAHTAFLIDPINIPAGVSLIVDGGVTVFASRSPGRYRVPGSPYLCGTVGPDYPVHGGCKPLVTLNSHSGIYGYGVLDGQAHRGLIRKDQFVSGTWWDLLLDKKNGCGSKSQAASVKATGGCEQASPPMIFSGPLSHAPQLKDLTLYKITIRNPQFHTTVLGATGITVWGVKVQAPWNVPNSDGFDLHGTDILVKDVTVANGDQDVVLTTPDDAVTSRVTVDGPTLYSKGGVALLGDGKGISDVLVRNVAMTGGVTSFKKTQGPGGEKVLINGQDPLVMKLRRTTERLQSYGQALPTATDNLQGLQLNFNLQPGVQKPPPTLFSNITFQSVCLQDVVWPIHIGPVNPYISNTVPMPSVSGVLFRDVHVLSPTWQFPKMEKGIVQAGSGTYRLDFVANPAARFFNHFALRNVVFDDLRNGRISMRQFAAQGNRLQTLDNIYPRALNGLDGDPSKAPGGWTISHNSYAKKAGVSDPALAIPCPASRWSYLTGELYLSRPGSLPMQTIEIAAGSDVAVNAVLQPAMSQTTWFMPESYGATPGLLAIGAPALTEAIQFYEGNTLVGTGRLGANGTLATATIRKVTRGLHTYSAKYPGDDHYKPFVFGAVKVKAN